MLSPLLAFSWTDPTALIVIAVAAIVSVIALIEFSGPAHHPQQPGRHRRKALVAERLGARRPHHRPERRGRLPGRPAARRPALRPVALAVPHPQGRPGHHSAGQDRLRLCPRRRAAAAQPDAGPGRRLQQLPGRPRLPRRAGEAKAPAARPARPAAGHPARRRLRHQPRPCSSSSPRTPSTACSTAGPARARSRRPSWQQRAARESTASARVVGRRAAVADASRSRLDARTQTAIDGGHHRHRHRPRRPLAGRRARSSPRRSATTATTRTTTTTTRTPRRSCAPAAAAAGSTCR